MRSSVEREKESPIPHGTLRKRKLAGFRLIPSFKDRPVILVSFSRHAVAKRNMPPVADYFRRRHGSIATKTNDHANDPMPSLQAHFPELRRRMSGVRIETPARHAIKMAAAGSRSHLRLRAGCHRPDGDENHRTKRGALVAEPGHREESPAGGALAAPLHSLGDLFKLLE